MNAPDQPVAAPGQVEYGIGSYWGQNVSFRLWTVDERIVIGKFCSIADEVTICTGGGHRSELVSTWPFDNFLLNKPNPTRTYKGTRNTTIGDDVWIGHGAHIVGGVQIGTGAIIGTRAVVFDDVPPYAIVVGNPAKVVRYRFSPPTIARLLRIAWWNWPLETIKENIEWFYKPIGEFLKHFDPPSSHA